jgi:RNA ligase (TIGR02306 family)
MRKLATIQQIRKLVPIPGADRIELAQINDWVCIVKKGEFEVNDLCVYFEIDSLLPEDERYEFLASSKKDYFGKPKYRIKTMKMRGVISQGLALPLGMYLELRHNSLGDDVSEAPGVIKYDPGFYTDNGQKPRTGNTKGKFPSFIPKTDQERIQNLPHYYELYKEHEWEETLKLDGSSLTVYKVEIETTVWHRVRRWLGFNMSNTHTGVCSRNLELKSSDKRVYKFANDGKESVYNQSDFWQIVLDLEIEKYLPVGYALQGELIGPKIQANWEKVDSNQFWVFDVYDVYDITNGRYLLPLERHEFLDKYFKSSRLQHVPVVSLGLPVFTHCQDLEALQERVTGASINPGTISEGRVYKSMSVPGLSFKCISNQYLLKAD